MPPDVCSVFSFPMMIIRANTNSFGRLLAIMWRERHGRSFKQFGANSATSARTFWPTRRLVSEACQCEPLELIGLSAQEEGLPERNRVVETGRLQLH
jgi:hypothetical protein